MKIEKILLPYDGSTHSRHAAEYARDLAKISNAQVTIVYCYEEWDSAVTEIPENLIAEIKENRKLDAQEILKGAEGVFENSGVPYAIETINGEPGLVLANLSKAKTYDLIIMGSHGHSDIAGLFLGSVTHKVLNTIYCPVLVVP